MKGCVYILLVSVLLIPVDSKHYLYRSRYNWKPQWAEPVIEYSDALVPPPCPGAGVTPCPVAPDTLVTASTTTETTTTTLASTASTAVPAPTTPPVPATTTADPTSAMRDCIADGDGICTASCNIGTFTLEDTSFSCDGNGIGSVCCLEP